MSHDFNVQFADLVLRCVTGILFLFQGYQKAFTMNASEIVNAFQTDITKKILPGNFLKFTVRLSAYIEFIGGMMLLAGFQRDTALYVLSAQMVFVTIAFSLIRPMWDMQYFFPRFVFLFVLLVLPQEWDRFSIDALMR